MSDDGAMVYYPCSSCKRSTRETDIKHLPILGLRICPDCRQDHELLEFATLDPRDLARIVEGLRNLPDEPGQTLVEFSPPD